MALPLEPVPDPELGEQVHHTGVAPKKMCVARPHWSSPSWNAATLPSMVAGLEHDGLCPSTRHRPPRAPRARRRHLEASGPLVLEELAQRLGLPEGLVRSPAWESHCRTKLRPRGPRARIPAPSPRRSALRGRGGGPVGNPTTLFAFVLVAMLGPRCVVFGRSARTSAVFVGWCLDPSFRYPHRAFLASFPGRIRAPVPTPKYF